MAKSCIMRDVQQTQALFSQGRQARKPPAPAVERSKLPYTPSSSTRTPAPVVVRAVKTPAPTIPTKKPSPLASGPSSTPAAPIRALPPASPRRPTVPLASTGKRQRDGEGLQKPEETRAERMKAAPRRLQNIGPVPTTAIATASTITAATITTSTATTATTITITATVTATTATTPPATTITASTTATTATATTASTATITAATSCSEKDVETIAAAKKIAEVHCCHQPQHENEGWVRVPYLSDEDEGKEVAGAFVHLPVTILPPTCGQVCDEGTVYVRPGGGPPTREWYHEDQRVVWKVPKSIILDKVILTFSAASRDARCLRNMVPAGKGAKCDACHDDRRGCSWTPDGLELLCNYCADAPRREVGDYCVLGQKPPDTWCCFPWQRG
ncbi:hypothetical protein Esi_0199_0011 [Ectocarpus siliculosus]|uniref:Uncharacterized protein n=1 Tax=Ectocarpus siliculosus TaxID=2880 RepID=D7FPS6_ECTSI|nr:hypothetical protein Esi_0199_0011 [Ectocarpus siliculosus]|eukprot:CBJ30533.1 hypothetical protein Esi_0199_0011 [Ectocarpus siliculosus]